MKSFMIHFIIGIIYLNLIVSKIDALQCYTCETCSSTELGKQTNCTSKQPYCMKKKLSAVVVDLISRDCAETCNDGKSSLAVVSNEMSCCQTDLCNTGFKPTSTNLVLIASLFGFLFSQIFKL
ncbi:unnamed protein product [Brachionus calyciflorus]|uniref:UPAR/Ly6 domain-containing protein n=1 Tax=Brachionus calyciflorus TaxID=104777 RepID=A0A813XQD6_9BILA|nr:unnamed protein product [Brachionus calyciflorus]